MSALPSHAQLLTMRYREELLRVVINEEIRFVTEDIRRIAKVPVSAFDQPDKADVAFCAGVPELERIATLGWSQALNLINMGDLATEAVQHFGAWFLHDLIAHLCTETKLSGTGIIDTSIVRYSSIFRHAMASEQVPCPTGSAFLFH
jgi:hypothetical protein